MSLSSSLRFFSPPQRRSCFSRCTRVRGSFSSPSPPHELSYPVETNRDFLSLLLQSTPSTSSSPQTPFPLPTAYSSTSSFSSSSFRSFSSPHVEMPQNRRPISSSCTTTRLHRLVNTYKETRAHKRPSSSSQEATGEDEELAISIRSSLSQGGDSHERRIRNAYATRRRRIDQVDGLSCRRPNNNDFFISLPLSLRSSFLSSFHSLLSPSLLLRFTLHRHHQTHPRRDLSLDLYSSVTFLRLFSSSSSRNSLSGPSHSTDSTSLNTSSTSPPSSPSTGDRKPSHSPALKSSSSSPCNSPPSVEASSTSSLPSPVSPSNQPAEASRLKGISQRDAELHGSALEAMFSTALKEKEEKALHAARHRGIELYPGGPVDRYGPPRDPSSLLIEPHKLTREERFFQKIFVGLPWIFFLCMLSTPIALVRYHVRKLEERKAFTREVAEDLAQASHVDFFRLCSNFEELREVIEQPVHTFICYFHPKTLSSHVILPMLRDVSELFRRLGVRASIAAVDISDRLTTPPHIYRVFPSALTPHGQVLLPFAYGGQQPAVIPFEGPWTASGIVNALADQVPSAAAALDFTRKLEDTTEDLRDCLFSLAFVDGSPESEGSQEAPTGGSKNNGGKEIPGSLKTPTSIGDSTSYRNPIEPVVDLDTAGETLHTAIRACETARAKLREQGHQQQTLQK